MNRRILIFGLVILCFACSGTQKIRIDKIKLNFKPEIDLLLDSNDLIINFTLVIPSDSTSENLKPDLIKLVKIYILDENNQLIDSSSINSFQKASKTVKEFNVIYFGKAIIKNFKKENLDKLNCNFIVEGDGWKLTLIEKFNELLYPETEPALSIYPIIESINNNSVDLGIFAVRKRIVEEYIPNSENIRIEVLNSKNKPVYNSQNGKAFMQVIMPVEPQDLGDSYIYQYRWDYKNNNGSRVPTGEYTIKMIIPANPKPYITEIKIPVETK